MVWLGSNLHWACWVHAVCEVRIQAHVIVNIPLYYFGNP